MRISWTGISFQTLLICYGKPKAIATQLLDPFIRSINSDAKDRDNQIFISSMDAFAERTENNHRPRMLIQQNGLLPYRDRNGGSLAYENYTRGCAERCVLPNAPYCCFFDRLKIHTPQMTAPTIIRGSSSDK